MALIELKRVKAINLYSFNSLDINLEQLPQSIAISGYNEDEKTANGAGKSSIFKIIYYALSGKSPFGEPLSLIQNLNSEYSASLIEFTRGADVYKIIRLNSVPFEMAESFEPSIPITGAKLSGLYVYQNNTQLFFQDKTTAESYIDQITFPDDILGFLLLPSEFDSILTVSDRDIKELLSQIMGLSRIDDALEKTQAIAKKYAEEQRRLQSERLASMSVIEKTKKAIEAETLALDIAKKELVIKKGEIENNKAAIREKIKEAELSIKDAHGRLDAMKYNPDIIRKYVDEVKTLERSILKKEGEVGSIRAQIDRLSAELADLEKNIEFLSLKKIPPSIQFQGRLAKISLSIKAKQEELASLMKNSDTCPVCGSKANPEHIEKKKSDVLGKIAELKEEANTEASKIEESLRAKIADIKSSLDGLRKTESELLCAIEKEKSVVAETNLKIESAKMDDSYQAANALASKIKNMEKALLDFNKELQSLEYKEKEEEGKIDISQKEIDRLNKIIDQETETLSKCENELTKLSDDIKVIEFWLEGFGPSGIKSFISDDAINELNSIISLIIDRLYNGKISLALSPEKQTKSGKTTNSIEKIIKIDGKRVSISNLSKGERRRVELAARIAMIKLIQQYIGDMNIMLLDEPFEGLDSDAASSALSILKEIFRDKKMFVISHDQHLVNSMGLHIFVKKSCGISFIE